MGPQPPLKRRPTHTPYTRPCKRDISAKLTPAGVGACTHTARSKKPSYHPPCGYIYIYIHTRTSIPWPRIDTSLSQVSTYFDHYRLISTLCSPWSAHRNSPLFSPDIFGFQLFHPFVIRGSIPFPSRCLREFSASRFTHAAV